MDWTPLKTGVITDDYQASLRLIRESARADESEDVVLREFQVWGRAAALLYVDGMAERDSLQRFLLEPLLNAAPPDAGCAIEDYLSNTALPLASLSSTTSLTAVINRVFSGDAALILDGMTGALIADMKGFVKRGPGDPHNETIVDGPHEGFTESIRDNTVLIRRLMRSPALISKEASVGNKVPSRLCFM